MTKIEWADITINPIVGCSHCSPGCDHCYAERFAARLAKNPKTAEKYAGVVDQNGKWTGQVNASLCDKDMPHCVPGKNKRVFVGSMTDLFHPNVSDAARDAIFASILFDHIVTNGHGHTFIVLTKRSDRMLDYFSPGPETMLPRWGNAGNGWLHVGDGNEYFSEYAEGQTIPQPGHEKYPNLLHEYLWPLPHVWLGVTVCNQEEADTKIPILLQIPAAKRFVSVEPMLGPVDLMRYLKMEERHYIGDNVSGFIDYYPLLHWVICGGETGPGARPMHPTWVRSLRNQCQHAGIPFFFKGLGDWLPCTQSPDDLDISRYPVGDIGSDGIFIPPPAYEIPLRNGVRCEDTFHVGKKRAGRLLDGREWNEIPEVL